MARTLEELASQLSSDPEFNKLPQTEQDTVFATLASEIEQSPAQPSSNATLSQPSPITGSELFPQTSRAMQSPLTRSVGLALASDIPRLISKGSAFAMDRLGGSQRPFSAELRGGNIPLQNGQPSRFGEFARQIPGEVAQLGIMGGLGLAGLQVAKKAYMAEKTLVPDFLLGSPKKIAKASQKLDEAAHSVVKSLRPGGNLHEQVMKTAAKESASAWQPMTEVSNAIPGEIPLAEVKVALRARLESKDPGRLEAASSILDDIMKEYPTKTAPDLVDLSREISDSVSRAGIKGKKRFTFQDIVHTDLKGAIADVLEARAPLEMKGFVQQAKSAWAAYASDWDNVYRIFQPNASQNAPTKTGIKFLRNAAIGKIAPDDVEFLGRFIEASKLDLPATIKPFAKAFLKATRSGKTGRTIGNVATRAVPYAVGGELIRRGISSR